MLRTSESESEILLGNKQLLGIFLVIAVLLGVAFTGGYLVGHGAGGRKGATATAEAASQPGASAPSAGGQTHTIEGEPPSVSQAAGNDLPASTLASRNETADEPAKPVPGARSHIPAPKASAPEPKAAEMETGYAPHSGTQYLQVAAVGKDEAEAVADVLHKRGFHAHAVPKPGNVKLYRVIIGPVKDAGELSSTRDALRKTGFREVIVQRY